MIKAILLDFGGVLFVDKEQFNGPTGNLSNNPDYWKRARVGKVDDATVFADIADRFETDSETVKSWFFSRREPNADLLKLLDELRDEIKVGLINNGLKTLFYGYLEKFELTYKFDVLIQSAEVGVEKPDKRIYQIAFEKLDIEPEEAVFVDDNETNVEGARKAGMQAFDIRNTDLKKEFTNLGLMK